MRAMATTFAWTLRAALPKTGRLSHVAGRQEERKIGMGLSDRTAVIAAALSTVLSWGAVAESVPDAAVALCRHQGWPEVACQCSAEALAAETAAADHRLYRATAATYLDELATGTSFADAWRLAVAAVARAAGQDAEALRLRLGHVGQAHRVLIDACLAE